VPACPKPKVRKQRKRFAARRLPEYMAWIHTQPCVLLDARGGNYHRCGPVEGCHVKSRGAGGDDAGNLVSMCQHGHRAQHRLGTRTFEEVWGVDLKAEAARLWNLYLVERG
jgi:hypothetical protein